MVGGFQCHEEDVLCAGVRVATIIVHGSCVAPVVAHGGVVVLPIGKGGRQSIVAPVIVPLCIVALPPRPGICLCCRLCCTRVVEHCRRMIRRGGGGDNDGLLSSIWLWTGGVILPQQLQLPPHPNPSPASNHHHLCCCCCQHRHHHCCCRLSRQVGCHVVQLQFFFLRSSGAVKCCHLK
jgi:hypothetical protein